MRLGLIAATSLVNAGILAAAVTPDQPRNPRFVRSTFGPAAALGPGASAVIGQARGVPHEWGRSTAGFGKRLGSAFAKHVVKNVIQFPVAHIRHEELGYHPSGERGFKRRLAHALASTVVTRKTTTGRRTVASGELSGAIGSGLISRLWQPASLHTVSSGFASGGITLGADAGINVVKEFWPRRQRSRSEK